MINFYRRNKSILQLSGANMLVLALPTLLLPVFTRLYSVNDFAVFGVFTTLISLVMPFLSLHYQQAIPVPRKEEKIKALTQLSLVLLVIVSLFVSVVWYFVAPFRSLLDPDNLLVGFEIYIPLCLLAGGLVQIISHWILQGDMFSRFAMSKSVQAISQSVFRYFGGTKLMPFSGGLIWSFLVGMLFQIAFFAQKFTVGVFVGWNKIVAVAKEYKSFLRFGLSSSILFALGNFLPLIFLSHYFTPEVVGQYSLALRLGSIPVFVLASSFGQVYFAEVKKNLNNQQLITENLVGRLLKLSAIPVALGFFLAVPLGEIVVGAEWKLALEMLVILLPMLWLNFMVLPLTNVFELNNRQDLGFYYALLAVIFRLAPMYLALYSGADIYLAMLAMCVGGVLSNVCGVYLCRAAAYFSVAGILKKNVLWWLPTIFVAIIYFLFFK